MTVRKRRLVPLLATIGLLSCADAGGTAPADVAADARVRGADTSDAEVFLTDGTVDGGPDVPDVFGDTTDADATPDRPDAQDAQDAPEAGVPPLPPLQTLAEGFHVPLEPPPAGAPFAVIMASDPQLWWNFANGQSGLSDEEVEEQNRRHVAAMNVLIAGEKLPADHVAPRAVMMNGDLTEYGRWVQWDAYYRLYGDVDAPIFDGLGNHDYENNNSYVSDGCAMDMTDLGLWGEACDAGSTETLWGESACEVKAHFTEFWGWCASDTMRRMRFWLRNHADDLYDYDEGSAAYSWEMGNIHFVQLHDYPDYEVPETQICSAIPWLKKDLKSAFERGKRIVLGMHRPISSSMTAHLEGYQYNIVAIFYGHIHRRVGFDGLFAIGGVGIPRFYCGSAEWNLFSLATFAPDRLTVTVIDAHSGEPVHHLTEVDYEVSGATIAAPHTYEYPVHACPEGQIPDYPGGPCLTPELETPPIELCYPSGSASDAQEDPDGR